MMENSPLDKSSLINRIPNEIFRKIIQYAYTPEPEKTEKLALYLPLLSPPLNASHVCRSWRNDLLSDPTMWANLQIPKIKSAGIVELIRRSQSIPLEVSIRLKLQTNSSPPEPVTSALLSTIFQHLSRFKLLQVDINVYREPFAHVDHSFDDSNDLHPLVRQLLTYLEQPAPELQRFSFQYYNQDHFLESTFIDTPFSGQAPNLKYIRHICFNDLREITCPLFRNLSELLISFPYRMKLDFDRFLDLLELSPCLTLLCVDISWDLTCTMLPPINRMLDLPHLQRLVLIINHSNRPVNLLDMILRHITFSENVEWNITSLPFEDREQKPGLSYSESKVMQILRKAHFTFVSILVSVSGEYLYLSLAEMHGSGSRINEPRGNIIVYTYRSLSQLTSHWDSLMELIDPSGLSRLHLIFLMPCSLSKTRLKKAVISTGYLFRLILLMRSFPHIKSYAYSVWIKRLDGYCDFINADDLHLN